MDPSCLTQGAIEGVRGKKLLLFGGESQVISKQLERCLEQHLTGGSADNH